MYIDPSGNSSIAADWGWLREADGPYPFGDLAYYIIWGGSYLYSKLPKAYTLTINGESSYDTTQTVPAVEPHPAPVPSQEQNIEVSASRSQNYDDEDYEQNSSQIKSVAGAFGNPNNQNNKKNDKNNKKVQLKKIRSNEAANEVAKQKGFESAESFKESIVGTKNISKFNIKYNPDTGRIYLEAIQGGQQIVTRYYIY